MVRLSILCLLLGLYRVQSLFCGDFPENECVERNLCRIQSGHEGCSAAETCCPTKDVLRFPVPGVPACGYANRDSLTLNIAEEDTAEAELPWMVLLLDARNDQAVGGGSLIKPDVVLSATTATRNLLESQLIVRAGEWDLSSDTEMGKHEDVAIRKIVRHPDFQLNSGANNVALLFLERPLQRTRHINLICLPSPNRQFTRNRCIVSGWDKKNINDVSHASLMKKIEVPLVDNFTCEQKLRQLYSASFNLHDSLICAGGETGKDTCKVGGGSPLVCSHQSDPNRYEQVGIVNFGAECGEAIPTVYTDVSKMRPWIFQQILENLLGSQE
ncbi:phenoloxidase-activating factor 2-like [Drosophila subpulchrella]|uniref:phenoloxidase-activating factor 2-like n=1 Tax=Drosophila subpulchrella TaxID=1486046 RepID=UPI0018A1AA6F|nr:phenoloxidase-activating factor 2-like [Drosophila subpulchrella]